MALKKALINKLIKENGVHGAKLVGSCTNPHIADDGLQVDEMLSHEQHYYYMSMLENLYYLETKTGAEFALTASAFGVHDATPRQIRI